MKDLTWLKTSLIAHRGLYKENGAIPENSLKAFQEAMNHQYAIECDVNITKDGTVIVFHDDRLKRLTGLDKCVSEVTYNEIKALNLLISDQKIPTLKEVLELVDSKVPLLIELKPYGKLRLAKAFMDIMKDYKGIYAVFSFHPRIVLWFKKHYPNIIRGQISAFFEDDHHIKRPMKFMMKRMLFNPLTKPDFISYYIRDLPNKHVDKQKKKGITIISYTARLQQELDSIKAHYDNAVFEYFLPKENA